MVHKSQTHTEEHFHTDEKPARRQIVIIGISLISALIILFLLSTVFNFNLSGLGGESDDVLQMTPGDSVQTDSLLSQDVISVSGEPPEFWLQARACPEGNASWGPDIIAPFDTIWHLRSNGGREFFSSPAVLDDVLYFGCNDGLLRAVDAHNGSVLWSFSSTCGICGEPAVDSTSVYFGGQDGVVYALDRFSGSKRWSAGLGYHVFCNVGIYGDSLILTGNSMGKICALRVDNGDPVWVSEIGGTVLGPVIIDSMIVFSTENGKIAAFDADGNGLWSRQYNGQASPPSADTAGVYIGFSDGLVRKLTLHDGEVLWEKDIVESSSRCLLARPVIAGNMLLAGTNDGRLVALSSSTGDVLWEQNFENWLQLPPAVGDGCIYVSCDDQRMHLLDLCTGTKLDSFELGGYSGTAPVLSNATIYFGNTSGDFIALRGTNGTEIVKDTGTIGISEGISSETVESEQ